MQARKLDAYQRRLTREAGAPTRRLQLEAVRIEPRHGVHWGEWLLVVAAVVFAAAILRSVR